MYHRYRSHRKSSNHALPITAIGLTAAALLLWTIIAKGDDIYHFFKGQTIVVPSNAEANERLSQLLGDLSGDKAKLLQLAESSKTRLGWIENADTRRQFRYFLMMRLVDSGLWGEAVAILPEVESLAPVEGLNRLAAAAKEHEDYELQLRLDGALQDKAISMPEYTSLLLQSIRRTAETSIRMKRNDDAVKAIARLDVPAVQARLTSPDYAREAAALQMMRVDVCEVKEPVLQTVRNILEQAKWPACPATSRLMLEEITNTLRDSPNLSQTQLKEIEEKLTHCRDSMLEYPDKEHRLPQCYIMLGELRYRLNDFEGCAQALSLASAFAEGYGEMTPELRMKVCRARSRANEARGAVAEALRDCRYLVEHEKDQEEVMRCLSYLASNAEGKEKIDMLTRCWEMAKKDPRLMNDAERLLSIATELAAYYADANEFASAAKWSEECAKMAEEANPDKTSGKAFRARLAVALVYRKAKSDATAFRRLREIVREIDAMSEEDRERLKAADSSLYRTVLREISRTCLLMGDKDTARVYAKKIGESLPEKVR